MAIWAIADLHLSFGVPNKGMGVFGAQWMDHFEKIEAEWRKLIAPDDLVLIAGDISWAMHLKDACPDLNWIGSLPGTKMMIKGNHDYWWHSLNQIKKALPPSCHLIQNNALTWNDCAIAGARLWDTSEYSFGSLMEHQEGATTKILTESDTGADRDKIFERELNRLEMSLLAMNPKANKRVVMTHYPPIGLDLKASRVSALLEKYHVDACVFGHLHHVKPGTTVFGVRNGIAYHLVACDYLNFKPLKLLE